MATSPSPAMHPDPQTSPSRAPTDPTTAVKAGCSTPRQDLHPTQCWNKKLKDFIFRKVLGEGAFGTVVLGQEVATSRYYAFKIFDKKKLIKKKQVHYVTGELDILTRLDHPFCLKFYRAFQDKEKIYFVLSYAKNGDLQSFVEKMGPLDEACTRFYSAEMVLALEYLHGQNIIHRDLKPRNILLNDHMHIQIADFGSAKILLSCAKQDTANSFPGTTLYMSPELLKGESGSKSSDLWALGCVIYYLVAGLHPFQTQHVHLAFSKILSVAYDFPEAFFPNAKDLVRKLLVMDPTNRLGCEEMGSYGVLKGHPFFENISWDDLQFETPPGVTGSLDFTSEDKLEI